MDIDDWQDDDTDVDWDDEPEDTEAAEATYATDGAALGDADPDAPVEAGIEDLDVDLDDADADAIPDDESDYAGFTETGLSLEAAERFDVDVEPGVLDDVAPDAWLDDDSPDVLSVREILATVPETDLDIDVGWQDDAIARALDEGTGMG